MIRIKQIESSQKNNIIRKMESQIINFDVINEMSDEDNDNENQINSDITNKKESINL